MKVLLIDDEEDFCSLFKRTALKETIADEVDIVHDLDEGLALVQKEDSNYDFVVIDLIFPLSDAQHTYAKIQNLHVPVVIVSGLDKKQFEEMVGPMKWTYREKTKLLQSGGFVGALTELVFSYTHKERIRNIEKRVHHLEELNGVITKSDLMPPDTTIPPA